MEQKRCEFNGCVDVIRKTTCTCHVRAGCIFVAVCDLHSAEIVDIYESRIQPILRDSDYHKQVPHDVGTAVC